VRRGQDAAHALPSFLPLPFYEYQDLQPERLGVTQHHEAAAHQRHAPAPWPTALLQSGSHKRIKKNS
jgi:hypothetical protein